VGRIRKNASGDAILKLGEIFCLGIKHFAAVLKKKKSPAEPMKLGIKRRKTPASLKSTRLSENYF
jgi:hypothetical protein